MTSLPKRASPDYKGGTDEERQNRDMLRKLMEAAGFTVNPNEWWHFDYKDWDQYAIYDIPFSEAVAQEEQSNDTSIYANDSPS